jgi:hypothetical protein
MVVYDNLENFDKYKRIFHRYQNVKVSETKYSIKIDFGKKKVFLNSKDTYEGRNSVLQLISKVKRDSQRYLDNEKFETTRDNHIYWSYYNELAEYGKEPFECAKIDLNSAYWTKAINSGLISKETVDYFESIEWENVKEKKSARLKALGSLATVKKVCNYSYGSRETEELIYNQHYRNIYMWICGEVAKDMQTIMSMVNGVFYYWDCIFVDLESVPKVEEIITSLGYKFTVEKDIGEVFIGSNISYFFCHKTGIQYAIN